MASSASPVAADSTARPRPVEGKGTAPARRAQARRAAGRHARWLVTSLGALAGHHAGRQPREGVIEQAAVAALQSRVVRLEEQVDVLLRLVKNGFEGKGTAADDAGADRHAAADGAGARHHAAADNAGADCGTKVLIVVFLHPWMS